MECKIEHIFIPVTDVDRAIDFYVEKVGFTLDMQARATPVVLESPDAPGGKAVGRRHDRGGPRCCHAASGQRTTHRRHGHLPPGVSGGTLR